MKFETNSFVATQEAPVSRQSAAQRKNNDSSNQLNFRCRIRLFCASIRKTLFVQFNSKFVFVAFLLVACIECLVWHNRLEHFPNFWQFPSLGFFFNSFQFTRYSYMWPKKHARIIIIIFFRRSLCDAFMYLFVINFFSPLSAPPLLFNKIYIMSHKLWTFIWFSTHTKK